jgi:hypothetical protein
VSNGLFRLARVIAVVSSDDGDDFGEAIDDSRARQDDAWWARYIRLPYTPQRFLNWWIARRWVIPRDIRRS